MIKVKCKDCGKEIEINPRARFKRKYCPKCSAERKKAWGERWKVTIDDCED